ncbi:acyl carrier protein [Streptomyces sp. ITFR-16]|uniref:acyl carrier protein n=1 Tax=Streptomyces sp. ITFR-16 TaxID=3075198 RepID=UPI00288BDCC4|nr:acyl carrier protein [Streptomyces sp. ITFR-16]WNI27242.1 acyl carrier protein [Streptomyces sp. ITFR-16]
MTAAPPLPPHLPQTPVADVLAELTAILAGFVHVEAHTVDAGQTFTALGMDSLLNAQFLAMVNARYAISVPADALYRYPTPQDLAAHVAERLGAAPELHAPEPVAQPVTQAVPRPVAPPVAPPVPDAVSGAGVPETLRGQLARILGCAPGDIDATAPFTVLGLDSILAAQFVEGINRTWGLAEQSALFYEYPDLASLTAHIQERAATGGGEPALPAGTSAPFAAPRTTAEIEALLDAVRDDLIGIDQAAGLLDTRTA